MASAIEAGSLASLNALAANPPQYPTNPAEQKQDPLTLYISRVPGTRDVILSTSKPQLKNVTSHDVANSLYYIHLELPGEAPPPSLGVNTNFESPRSSSSFDGARAEPRIKRKPLPANAKVSPSPSPTAGGVSPSVGGSHESSLPPPYEQQSRDHPLPSLPSTSPERPPRPPPHQPSTLAARPAPDVRRWTGDGRTWYDVEDTPDMPGARSPPSNGPKPPQPHDFDLPSPPLPPRPNQAGGRLSPIKADFHRAAPPQHHDFEQPPSPMPPRPTQTSGPLSPGQSRPTRAEVPRAQAQGRARSRSPSPIRYHNSAAVPYILHLIRRDANTGHQWNVGTITSSQLEHALDEDYAYTSFDPAGLATAESRRKATAPQPDISVTLETSGYAKFRNMPSRRSIDDATRRALGPDAPGSGASNSHASLPRPGSSGNASVRTAPPTGFTRAVRMTYTKSLTSTIRSALASASLKPDDARSPPPRNPGHARNPSSTSAESAASSPEEQAPIITTPGPGLRPKGYMFLSPWDGACHFRTGNGGRSLKMRHALAAPHGAGEEEPPALLASELRFNLPGRELFYRGRDEAVARRAEIKGHLEKFIRGQHGAVVAAAPADPDEEDDDDMRLGREKAGGGNRGKRAKMGKLIVHPEGMKMLDLVVAANMGVWWGAWERSF